MMSRTTIFSLFRCACLSSFLIVALGCLNDYSYGQNGCRSENKDRVKYELVFAQKLTLPPFTRDASIVVNPKNFNSEYVLRLARALRQRFCTDNEISIVIFDEKRAAKETDVGQYLTGRVAVPALRGFYTLTNQGKDETIQFSTKRGNANNEVVLKLSTN